MTPLLASMICCTFYNITKQKLGFSWLQIFMSRTQDGVPLEIKNNAQHHYAEPNPIV
jgi:hypothetical protein